MSNRKAPPKQQVGIKLSPSGKADLIYLCDRDGVSQSGMFERLLHDERVRDGLRVDTLNEIRLMELKLKVSEKEEVNRLFVDSLIAARK